MSKMNELKAKAYDLIAGIERAQSMLRQINDEIAVEAKKEADAAAIKDGQPKAD